MLTPRRYQLLCIYNLKISWKHSSFSLLHLKSKKISFTWQHWNVKRKQCTWTVNLHIYWNINITNNTILSTLSTTRIKNTIANNKLNVILLTYIYIIQSALCEFFSHQLAFESGRVWRCNWWKLWCRLIATPNAINVTVELVWNKDKLGPKKTAFTDRWLVKI